MIFVCDQSPRRPNNYLSCCDSSFCSWIFVGYLKKTFIRIPISLFYFYYYFSTYRFFFNYCFHFFMKLSINVWISAGKSIFLYFVSIIIFQLIGIFFKCFFHGSIILSSSCVSMYRYPMVNLFINVSLKKSMS